MPKRFEYNYILNYVKHATVSSKETEVRTEVYCRIGSALHIVTTWMELNK